MHSEQNVAILQRSTFIATLNYSLATIFGTQVDDGGIARRIWQMQFKAKPQDWERGENGIPKGMDFREIKWDKVWASIDEDSESAPKFLAKEYVDKIQQFQIRTVNANWLDDIITTAGITELAGDETGDEVVAIKRPKLHAWILKILQKEDFVGGKIGAPWVRLKLDKYLSARDISSAKSKNGNTGVVICRREELHDDLLRPQMLAYGTFVYDNGVEHELKRQVPAVTVGGR